MRAGIIIQARFSSQRLPGKMMMPLAGIPLCEYVYNRCLRCKSVEKVVLATSSEPTDNAIFEHATAAGLNSFRGSLNNVLDRYLKCAREYGFGAVVRVCGDSPFADVDLIDELLEVFEKEKLEYLALDKTVCVAGLDFEIVRTESLAKIFDHAVNASDLEHVTKFIRENKGIFKSAVIQRKLMIDELPALKLTVDEKDDYLLVSDIAEILRRTGKGFGFKTEDVFEAVRALKLLAGRKFD